MDPPGVGGPEGPRGGDEDRPEHDPARGDRGRRWTRPLRGRAAGGRRRERDGPQRRIHRPRGGAHPRDLRGPSIHGAAPWRGREAVEGPGVREGPPGRGQARHVVRRSPYGVRGVGEPQRRGRRPTKGLRGPRALRELRGPGDASGTSAAVRRAVPPRGRTHAAWLRDLQELPEGVRGAEVRTDRELLAEAVKDLHKEETLERALSRILRRYGGTYDEYIRIMGEVRELANREKITALEAARKLSQL